jgi:UDP-N-acetylglucosamine 2-epimerase
VYGDTNSTLAGALAGRDTKTKIIHLEAGLRSFDLRMPEERNRMMVDKISDYLFCPSTLSREFLRLEGIKNNVFVTGNLIVDVSKKISKVKLRNNRESYKNYILLTLHRAENVDDKDSLKIIMEKLKDVSKYKIIFPVHPRTKKNIKINNIKIPKNVKIIDPLSYIEFLSLLKQAKLILTDSGGIQEEAIILKKPCITLRYTTERWETILVGGNRLFPIISNNHGFAKIVEEMMANKIINQPYGENVTKKTVNKIKKIFNDCKNKKSTTIKIASINQR